MRRLTILLAAVGAMLLIPAGQAVAGTPSTGVLKVTIAGTGAGQVIGEVPGETILQCSYTSPGPQTGTCQNHYEKEGTEEGELITAKEAAGSEFVSWTITKGVDAYGVCGFKFEYNESYACVVAPESPGATIEVTATFNIAAPSGPTNLRTLTLTKSPSSSTGGGVGTVSSKPKGIKCGTTCDEAVAAEYKETPVELTAKPATGSTFVEWTGACSGSSPTCTVPMAEDESVQAVFGGVSKAFSPAEVLTLEKAGSGKGTVKAAGLGCEAECTSTTVLYQGPITEPKPKPGKVVILKQVPAFGSTFSGWSGCDTETEAGECVVAMEEDRTVTAEYTALPNKALTVNKAYSTGNGSVASKPKGIKCGTTCTQAVAQMPEGASVELVAKPNLETTFVGWVGGDCEGSTNPVCVVTMNADETTEAVFSKAGKAFLSGSEPALTLTKTGSGFGTVKAAGLTCEVLCSSTTALYQGPITEPKPKVGKTVILKAISAPGSKKVVWSGCDTETEAGECVVAMEEAKEVTATFDELE